MNSDKSNMFTKQIPEIPKNTLALFDFDGTITFRDSLIDFIKFAVGYSRFLRGILLLSPVIFAYKLKTLPNWKAKEAVLTHFFGGWNSKLFDEKAMQYGSRKLPDIVRKVAFERLLFHKDAGHEIVIVSASIENYLKHWCKKYDFGLIATKLEVVDSKITGRISGKNCYGAEKIKRIKERLNLAHFESIYAYGDSPGDFDMQRLANEKYYRWKKMA